MTFWKHHPETTSNTSQTATKTRSLRKIGTAKCAFPLSSKEGPAEMFRFSFVAALLFTMSAVSADDSPCGPEGVPPFLKRLIPQGFAGADFRPACRQHDDCYDNHGVPRKHCDQAFRADMYRACENSRHPRLCRMTANRRYRTVRLLGAPYRK